MAYFSNGTEGSVFDEQCMRCRYGEEPCPIASMQMEFNYEACNIPVARKILDWLVKDNGTCTMFEEFKKDLSLKTDTDLPIVDAEMYYFLKLRLENCINEIKYLQGLIKEEISKNPEAFNSEVISTIDKKLGEKLRLENLKNYYIDKFDMEENV